MSGFGGSRMSFFPPTLFNPYLPSAENLLQILILVISSFWSLPKRAVTKDWELEDIIWWIESFALRLCFPQQNWSRWHLNYSCCCTKLTLHPPSSSFSFFVWTERSASAWESCNCVASVASDACLNYWIRWKRTNELNCDQDLSYSIPHAGGGYVKSASKVKLVEEEQGSTSRHDCPCRNSVSNNLS